MTPKTLLSLGFSKKEAAVLAALVKRRLTKAVELARDSGLPRQTVYSILEKLVHEGVVTGTSGKGVRQFACDHAQLLKYVDEKLKRFRTIRESLSSGYSAPLAQLSSPARLPAVTYYEGAIGLERLFNSILDLYRKGKSKEFRGYGINFFSHTRGLSEYMRYFIKKRASYGVKTYLFIAKGPDDFGIVDERTRYNRTIKHLDIDEQNAGVYLAGPRAYLFSYKDNVGVMVENQAITELLKSAFDDHWQKSS